MKKVIRSDAAPAPIGPYNQAVFINGLLFISGQIALDPSQGDRMIQDDIQVETRQVLENIRAILDEADMTFDSVIKCSVFVRNMDQYNLINEVYATYFQEDTAPAREVVEVSRLPKHANLEISLIAAQ